MAKEQKTREELLELLDKAIAKHRLGCNTKRTMEEVRFFGKR